MPSFAWRTPTTFAVILSRLFPTKMPVSKTGAGCRTRCASFTWQGNPETVTCVPRTITHSHELHFNARGSPPSARRARSPGPGGGPGASSRPSAHPTSVQVRPFTQPQQRAHPSFPRLARPSQALEHHLHSCPNHWGANPLRYIAHILHDFRRNTDPSFVGPYHAPCHQHAPYHRTRDILPYSLLPRQM